MICNICKNNNSVKFNDPGVKDEYLYDEITNEELINPIIEFKLIEEESILENPIKSKFIYIYHLSFIDISELSMELNFGKYVKISYF